MSIDWSGWLKKVFGASNRPAKEKKDDAGIAIDGSSAGSGGDGGDAVGIQMAPITLVHLMEVLTARVLRIHAVATAAEGMVAAVAIESSPWLIYNVRLSRISMRTSQPTSAVK